MNFLKHSTLHSCIFMPPEVGEITLEKCSKYLKFSKPSTGKGNKNNITERLSKYKMSIKINNNLNKFTEEVSNCKRGFSIENEREIAIPYLHVHRKLNKGSVVMLHANADDIFKLEKQALKLSSELNV